MKRVMLVGALLLGACLIQHGSNGQDCYPNGTCDHGLVCVQPGVPSFQYGVCHDPNTLRVNAWPVFPDGGTR